MFLLDHYPSLLFLPRHQGFSGEPTSGQSQSGGSSLLTRSMHVTQAWPGRTFFPSDTAPLLRVA